MKKIIDYWKRLYLLERICIIMCLLVSVLAIICIVVAIYGNHLLNVECNSIITVAYEEETLIETTTYATEELITTEESDPDNEEWTEPTQTIDNADEDSNLEEDTKPTEEPVYNLQDNLADWFLANDNTTPMTLWKKNDEEGNLFLSLKDENGETLMTCQYLREDYDWIANGNYEWVLCEDYYFEITSENVIDCSFVGYREEGGRVAKHVQFQVMVLFNRDNSHEFADTIRGVITQTNPIQYSSKNDVIYRRLKSNNDAEKQDLERCFRATLLVFAGELVEPVPSDIVWAAKFPQGSAVWYVHDGVYYCHR